MNGKRMTCSTLKRFSFFLLVSSILTLPVQVSAFCNTECVRPSTFDMSAATVNMMSKKSSSFPLHASSSSDEKNPFSKPSGSKGRILILGGSGFLGQAIARRAVLEGYSVSSISRRGKSPDSEENEVAIEYFKVRTSTFN